MAMSPVQRESALGLVHCFPEVPQAGMDGAELMVNPSFQLVVSSGLTEAERMPALRYGRVGLPDTRKAGAANLGSSLAAGDRSRPAAWPLPVLPLRCRSGWCG